LAAARPHTVNSPGGTTGADSPWSPLAFPTFRALWIASLAADIGSAMHGVGAGWLMTRLSSSPFVVSLVQVAAMVPLFILLLPAGALGDIVERRKLLIGAECWSLLAALAMAIAAADGAMTPELLLAMTFALAIGSALATPAFQAVVPELVPKPVVAPAVTLNSMGFNIARAAGPAIAGLVIATLGVAAVFFMNAASFLATIVVLWRWRRRPLPGPLPPEHFVSAIQVGWRYAIRNREFLTILLRSFLFFTFAAALWALLPLVGATKAGAGPYGYAILLSGLGVGAVAAALTLPRVRRIATPNALVISGSLLFACATAVAALSDSFVVVAASMVPAGWSWLANVTSLNVAARFAIADWVMARGLAMNQMVFFGSSAFGAATWGALAQQTSVEASLLAAAACIVLAAAAGALLKLPAARRDMEPTRHWAHPHVDVQAQDQPGPVQVSIEYGVAPSDVETFLLAARDLERSRRRNGAIAWRLYRDLEDPARFVEQFVESSWTDHLRHHERTVAEDREAQEKLRRLQRGGGVPKVSHLTLVTEIPGGK